jgi:hypothetical protein
MTTAEARVRRLSKAIEGLDAEQRPEVVRLLVRRVWYDPAGNITVE